MLTFAMTLVLPGAWLVTRVFAPVLPALRLVRSKLLPSVAAYPAQRRMNQSEVARDSRGFAEGQVVRLAGRVAACSPAATGQPVVLRRFVRDALGRVLSDGRLVRDFDLALPGGEVVRVHAEGAALGESLMLLDGAEDHWDRHGLTRRWFCESRVHPGDWVEVFGYLVREIDPQASPDGFRHPPLRWSVVPGPGQPLLIRFSTTAALAASGHHDWRELRLPALPR